ncbi:Bifunctional protein HldE, partial [Haemophilus influenzae]
KIK